MYFLLDICRLCLSHKNEFYDLSNDDIMEKLVTCISDLEFEDHIPSVICDECLEQVDLYYEFRNKCLRSEFIINNYVEKLLGVNTNSHLRSKLQVKLSKNFSSSKFPSNVKLPHSTLPMANPSKNTNMNENNKEDSSLDEVHTDITERVKLRKRFPVKRLQSITPEKRLPSVNSSPVTKNARQNLPLRLHCSPIVSEESDSSVVNSSIPEAFERVSFDPSQYPQTSNSSPVTKNARQNLPLRLHCSPIISEGSDSSVVNSSISEAFERVSFDPSQYPQTSNQSKSCHIQAPVNANHDLTESSSRSINFKQNQPDNSNQNVAQQEKHEELTVNLHQNQISSENDPVNSNQHVLTENLGDIVIDNEETTIIEIKEEIDDPPDPEINHMLSESFVKERHSRLNSCTPSVNTPMQLKRKQYTMTNYVEQNTTKHILNVEHSYAGQLTNYHNLPCRKRLKNLRAPSIDSSSNSDNNDVDVEGVSENEEAAYYIDDNVRKNIKERNRRNTLRTYLEELVCALPSNIDLARRSQITVLKESEHYIKALQRDVCKSSHVLNTLKEKNLQLRDRLKEITIVRTNDS